MAESDLTLEERDHLYKMSAIAFTIVFSVVMLYFVYLMHTDPLKTLWDFIVRIGLPLAVGLPAAFFLVFEVLYYRRAKKKARFHLGRLANNVLIVIAGILSLFLVQGAFFVIFSTTLSERRAVLFGTGLWTLAFLIVVLKLRKRHLQKVLEQG